jgi:hypothetical protein
VQRERTTVNFATFYLPILELGLRRHASVLSFQVRTFDQHWLSDISPCRQLLQPYPNCTTSCELSRCARFQAHSRDREMASERAPSPAIERDRGKSPFEVVDRTDTSTSTHGVLSRDNWTEFIPPSDYVRFFISFDWSATALGPLYRWQIALRMHTFVLFADQRPGCLLWFVSCLSLPCLITYNNQGRRKGCHLQRSLLEFNGITYMPSWLTTSNNYARERTA